MSGTRSLKWPLADAGLSTAKSRRLTAVVVLGLLSAAAIVIAARALAGALRTPLESSTLLTVGVLTAAACVVVRLAWLFPVGIGPSRRLDAAIMATTSVAAAALCGGLCLPADTPPAAVIALGIVLVAEEGWAWLWFFRKWTRSYAPHAKSPPARPAHEKNSSDIFPAETKTPDPFVTQQLTRSLGADGAEELSGWLRLTFAAGQRTGSAHVAFCPPLRATPEVAVEQIEGPDARVKTAQLLPYGARFDLKLAAAADEPATVLLQFTARTPREE